MITSVSTSSTFADLTNHQLKTFEKQIQKIIKKQKLEFTAHQQLLIWQFPCIVWYMLSKDDLKYLGRCVKAKCECSAILYNGLEHLWSLVPMGDGVVAKINPLLRERQLCFPYVSCGHCPCLLKHFPWSHVFVSVSVTIYFHLQEPGWVQDRHPIKEYLYEYEWMRTQTYLQ